MKNNFQSKAVPRGTRTIWRYLGALFLLFSLAIGNVWAEDIVVTWPMIDGENATSQSGSASVANIVTVNNATLSTAYTSLAWGTSREMKYSTDGENEDITFYAGGVSITNNPTSSNSTINNNCYVEFTFVVKSGYTFTPTGFSFKIGRQGTDNGAAQGVLTLADASSSSVAIFQPERTDKKKNFSATEKSITGAGAFAAGSTVKFRVYIGGKLGGKTLYLADVQVLGTYAESGGAPTPVDPTATFSNGDYIVGKTLDLSTLYTSNSEGAVTYSITSAGATGATLASDGKTFSATAAGTATVKASQAATSAHNAVEKTATITVKECPTSGIVFSMNITAAEGTTYTGNNTFPALIDATYVGGAAYSGSKSSTNRTATIDANGEYPFGGHSELAIKVVMDCDLAEGDIINITTSSTRQIKIQKVVGTDLHKTADKTFTIPSGSPLIGENVFYLMRDNSESTLKSFTVIRPLYRTITLEYADGETPDGSIEVIDGTAATKPSDPTWAHHRFDGWYNGASPYDWTTTVSGDLTLTAHWTQLYTVTYAKGDEGATGDAPTQADKATTETFKVAANTFELAGKVFDHWNDGTADYNPEDTYTVGTSNVTLTAVWRTPSTMYAITKGTHTNGDFTIDPASQEAGEVVTLEATPDDGYLFGAWEVVKTEDASATGITVDANGQFTMPGYAVTVNATFAADPRKKILYVTNNDEATTKANDKLYEALKDDYRVTIVGPTSDADQTNYDLVVLHESIGGGNYGATAVAAAKTGNTPVLNTKSYFYNDGRWGWGAPNAGQSVKGATLNSSYCNIADHPLFDGVTMTAGFFEITDDAAAKCMQPVGSFTSGKEGYTLATTPNSGEGNGCAIHELTPAQRGASAGKYLMISVSGDKLNALNANGQKLFQNAAAYLIGSTAWEPEAPKTVTHTLTGVTTVSAEEVCAGVAYEATYVASAGYSLPASIVVKVNGAAIDGANYTWNQATGELAIPAAQVTNNIEIVVNGVFNCPAAGSGDVVFSWTPKSGSVSTEYIAAGGVDLAQYMESVVGGAITGYAQDIDETQTTLYKNSNNHIYFNGNPAYIQVDLCELAEGDKFLVSGQANNLWVSTSATRPADAASAAAVLVPDEAFYIPNASALIGLSTIYIFREADFTEVASLTITRPEKFTVTYEASDLTAGDVPAAVDAFNGQKIIVAGQGTMVKGADNFAGWKDAGDNAYAAGDELIVTSNLTLTAQWVSCTPLTLAMSGYTTTLTAGGATTTVTLDKGASTGTVTWESSDPTILTVADGVVTPLKGGAATVTAHVAEDGTYCANDITSDEITVNCVVAYDANGGEGTMADGTGTTVTIAANGFTYDSHKFLRWNTQPDGLGDDVAVGATVNENKTLYAIWKEVTCTAGANIFSIEFTNAAAVTMSDGDEELNLASYATIVGGNAYMKYYKGGTSDVTVINSSHKANYSTNDQYLRLELDCALQAGDVITVADGTGKQIAIAIGVVPPAQPTSSTKEVTDGYAYTVQAGDHLVGQDNLFLGRDGSGGTTHGTVTIYRPLPDASVPTIDAATPADASYAATAPIAAMTVSADAVAPKDLHYQWYKENGETDIEVGTDAASYTPTASGEYYCVVTNSPTGYTPKSATSRTATITMISSDATLVWIKAGDVNIALSAGVYNYEYTLPYDYAAATAPVITVGTTDPNANAEITQAATKTGTATIHVVAQDNVTVKDYSVKFNEYSGCMDAFWFAEEADATANSLTNNSTFFSNMVGDGTGVSATFEVDGTEYTVTRGTSSSSSFGKLTIPAGFNANVYVALKTSGGNRTVTLVPTSGPSYTSANLASSGNHVAEFEDVAAGTYNINVSSGSNFVMVKAHICKYPMEGVSLPATESVLVGQTVTLTPVFDPTNASNKNVTWESDDEDVATVANGVVTGVAAGTANITVTTEDGNFHATCTVTVSELDCDTYLGNLFALTIKDVEATSVSVSTTEIDMSTYATIENGTAFVARTEGSASHKIAYNQSSVIQFQYNTDKLYLKLNLQNCSLKEGDMITITGTEEDEFAFTTNTTRATTYKTTGHKYVVQYGDALVGASTIYVWRVSGNTYMKSISIDRVAPSYTRPVNPAYLGTLCWTNNAAIVGATLYEFAGKNENNYLVFDEVPENRLEAGKPYIFMPENGNTEIKLYNTDDAAPLTVDQDPVNHMYGTITGKTLVPGVDDNMYYFSSSHIWAVKDFTANISVPAYYCYVDYVAVLAGAPASAPAAGRRRVTMGVNGKDAAQGFENILGGETPMKVMIDGTLYIIRGEKVFDATGRLVK